MKQVTETEFQQICSEVVSQEVYYCASNLFYTLSQCGASEKLDAEEREAFDRLTGANPDWEATAESEGARLFELKDTAEFFYLSEEEAADLLSAKFEKLDDHPEGFRVKLVHAHATVYARDWVTATQELLNLIEEGVDQPAWARDTSEEAAQAYCEEWSLDPEYNEIYEQWIVSGWLKRKLEEHGQTVDSFCNIDVWGRTTSGQSISIDGVIRDIVRESRQVEVASPAPCVDAAKLAAEASKYKVVYAGWLVDPETRTITEVEVDAEQADESVRRMIGAGSLEACDLDADDHVAFDAMLAEVDEPICKVWRLEDLAIRGKGVILGTSPITGDCQSSFSRDVTYYQGHIEWAEETEVTP